MNESNVFVKKEGIFRRIFSRNEFALIIVLILLVILFSMINPVFFSMRNFTTILLSSSVVGLLSIAQGYMIIGGAIDISIGATAAFVGVFTAKMISIMGFHWIIACLISLILGALVGVVNSILVNQFNLQPFIATLAMASVMEGAAYLICRGRSIPINKSQAAFLYLGTGKIVGIQIPIIIMIVCFIVFGIILAKTRFGRSVYMIGGNSVAANLAGIRPKRMLLKLYIMAGIFAAFAGIIVCSRMNTGAPSAILGSEFSAITAVVLGGVAFNGGKGNMVGCFIGMLIIQVFSNGLTTMGVSSFWQKVATGILLILALILDDYRTKNALKSKIRLTASK